MPKLTDLQRGMQEKGIAATVLRLAENVLMFTGYWPRNGMSFLVIPSEGDPRLLVPHGDEEAASKGTIKDVQAFGWSRLSDGDPWISIKKLLSQFAKYHAILPASSIGIEQGFEIASPSLCAAEMLLPGEQTISLLKDAFRSDKLTPVIADLDEIRAFKTDLEIERVNLANTVAKSALYNLQTSIVPGITEIKLAAQLEADIALLAAQQEGVTFGRAWAQVISGERTSLGYFPGQVSFNRPIQNGDFVMIELAVVVDGYWADLTRTYICGSPSAQQEKMLKVSLAAQKAAIAAIRDDVSASSVDQCARDVFKKEGLGEYFVHHTGHGVGFRYHETTPFIAPHSNEILRAGMIATIEPGLYISGIGGVRIEDNVLVTAEGSKVLGA